jgi:hypothetical protein
LKRYGNGSARTSIYCGDRDCLNQNEMRRLRCPLGDRCLILKRDGDDEAQRASQ